MPLDAKLRRDTKKSEAVFPQQLPRKSTARNVLFWLACTYRTSLRGKATMQLSKNRIFFCKPKIFLKPSRIRKKRPCGHEESRTD